MEIKINKYKNQLKIGNLKNFNSKNDIEINSLINDFIETHNSSLKEFGSTTYELVNVENNEQIGFFVLSIGKVSVNNKTKTFYNNYGLTLNWYSVVNIEFLIRHCDEKYSGLGDIILKKIEEIALKINNEINIKFILVNSIHKRKDYFYKKGFRPTNIKAFNSSKNIIEMLLTLKQN